MGRAAIKMKVDIEDIEEHVRYRKIINKVDLEDIEWYKGGKKIEIQKDTLDSFYFAGLSNIDFITTGYYLGFSE